MNLKQILREKLQEKEEKKKPKREYEYGCVMVYLNADKKAWDALQDQIEDDDIYIGEDGEGFGREMDPHVTVLFGIHADVPDENVEKLITEVKEPVIEMQKISAFKNDVFEVLKFDVKSNDLVKLNKKFKTLPHTNTFPEYHPHATICYLKKGKSDKYVKKFTDITPIEVEVDKMVYSKPGGGKKDYKIKK